uniref:Efflux RND transporter permease subunit n=1 Tax=candidate division WOR-3 bacterium TaxID=2052148 RepID=A0A7C4YHE1_UNCW3
MWNLAIRRAVTFTMIFLVLIFFGIWSYMRLNPDILPNIQIPIAGVICNYEGTAPEDFENLIVKPIETGCATVTGMSEINSIIMEGQSITLLKFNWGYDMDKAAMDIREKVDLVRSFLPQDMDKPMVIKFDPTMMPVMMLSFSGDIDLKTARKIAEDFIKPSLEKIDGVASVQVVGGLKREIDINLSKKLLFSYGISINDVVNSIAMQNLNLPSGKIEEGEKDIIIRTIGEFKSPKEIENVIVGYKGNVPVQIKDIGVVVDTFEEKTSIARINGNDGVLLQIYKESGAVTVDVSNKVLKEVKKISKLLPEKTEIKTIYDMADFINRSLRRIRSNILVGGILAVLVLYFFLQSIAPTLTIAISIPVSIIITFAVMDMLKITFNMMSMGGLALSVGMLVDNSIVVLENIYRRRKEEKEGRIEAASNGTREVGMAITASTLTTIMVFLPIVLIPGMVGIIARDFALTVVATLTVSLFVALTLVPMISARFFKDTKLKGGIIDRIHENILRFIDNMIDSYKKGLRWSLNHKKIIVYSTLALFIFSLMLIKPFGFIGTEFMSKTDVGSISLNAKFPFGTDIESMERTLVDIEKVFQEKVPELDVIAAMAGSSEMGFMFSGGSNTASVMARLVKKDKRKYSQFQIVERIRPELKKIPGVDIKVSEQEMSMLLMGTISSTIEINLFGNDLKELERISEIIKSNIEKVKGIRDVELSTKEKTKELVLKISREKAQVYGLPVALISSTVNSYLQGKTATIYREKGEDYYVKVKLDENDRKTLSDIMNLPLKTPFGSIITLSDVARFEKDYAPTTITRKNQKRFVTISASYFGRDLGSIVKDIQKEIKKVPLPEGYYIEMGGEVEQQRESFKWLSFAIVGAIFLVYMVMCALYESFIDPFVIMFTVPLSLIGVIWILFLTGTTINVMSLIGIAVLAGIVVNNGIVMIDYINQLRAKKMKLEEAVITGASRRLRPILMTSLTTIIGMIPMAIGSGEGGSLRAPMGRAVIGGLTTSTFLSLFFLPVLYTIFESRIKKGKKD